MFITFLGTLNCLDLFFLFLPWDELKIWWGTRRREYYVALKNDGVEVDSLPGLCCSV